jgi:hypothetical protein
LFLSFGNIFIFLILFCNIFAEIWESEKQTPLTVFAYWHCAGQELHQSASIEVLELLKPFLVSLSLYHLLTNYSSNMLLASFSIDFQT